MAATGGGTPSMTPVSYVIDELRRSCGGVT